ncbi:hypothetical protein HELRODRAFT_161686 [Helobdella robusta]|uniref:Uncharacterized protein n=1 Tax=Helobdella robusta TaxID=6412 RepID=T1ERS6_HELRO|nr:hypothetical protein HELRODRAFT_161686 [Helobdella robusta]ESO02419.1 hypothetical protein HELRODRAFT_161686 [Helobdella robusta]
MFPNFSIFAKRKCEQFIDTVNIRGVDKIVKSQNVFITGSWTVGVILCSGFLLWQTSVLFNRYFSYPYNTVVRKSENKPIFPKITICNLNPKYNQHNYSYTEFVNQVEKITSKLDYEKLNITKDKMADILNKLQKPIGYFSNLPVVPYVNDSSYDRVFIVDQSVFDWNFKKLSGKEVITPIWHPAYYRCYTISFPTEIRSSVSAVSLVIYLNNFGDYIYPGTYGAGFTYSRANGLKVLVHDPGEDPDMKTGVSVGSGCEMSLKMQMVNRSRLPYPYQKNGCKDKNHINLTRSGFYSKSLCVEHCVQRITLQKCRCLSSGYRFTSEQLKKANETICGNVTKSNFQPVNNNETPQFISQLICSESIKVDDLCASKCLDSCQEISYHSPGQTAPWPEESQQLAFYKRYIYNSLYPNIDKFDKYKELQASFVGGLKNDSQIIRELKSLDLIRENFVQLNFIFENDYILHYNDVEAMSLTLFISSFGGTLSLWMGITAMTFIEIIEFIYLQVVSIFLEKKVENNSGKDGEVIEKDEE